MLCARDDAWSAPLWINPILRAGQRNHVDPEVGGFLNTSRKSIPSAPETAYSHRGHGTNMIYVDEENDLVVVARWIEGRAILPRRARSLRRIGPVARLGPCHATGAAGVRLHH